MPAALYPKPGTRGPYRYVRTVNGIEPDSAGNVDVEGSGGGTGPQGPAGPEGPSAYEVAVANGFVGTEAAWLASLVGPEGPEGPQGPPGEDGTDGAAGADGDPGLSAYEVAVAEGFVGDEAAWLASLVGPEGPEGPEGPAGADGAAGASGAPGTPGTPGAAGEDGLSAYEVAVAEGFVGDAAAWLASLVGPQGPEGDQGPQGEPGTPGADGDDGADGADGRTVLNGTTAPTGGADGDFYLRTDTSVLYGPKAGGVWPGVGVSLIGPQGPEGDPGPQGDPGAPTTLAGLGVTATAAELNHVDGVTSAIQTQLDAKAPTASPTFTGTVTLPTGLTGVLRADSGVVSADSDVTDLVAAASDTAAGKVELATNAETTIGTDTTRALTPANLTSQIGTRLQAYDADLATIASLDATTDNFIVAVASAWASRTPAQVKALLALTSSNISDFASAAKTAVGSSLAATLTTRTNSTSELAFYSTSIAAGTLDPGDVIMGVIGFTYIANAAGTWTIRMKLGGTVLVASTAVTPTANASARRAKIHYSLRAVTTSSQTCEWDAISTGAIATDWGVGIGASWPNGVGVYGSGAINTESASRDLEFTIQWSAASTSISITPVHHATVLHKA